MIPLCHQIALEVVEVDFTPIPPTHAANPGARRDNARTGVEMEALVAVSAAALTIYEWRRRSIGRWRSARFG